MTRVLLHREGLFMAKAGFTVDAAEKDMLFSSNGLATRVLAKGIVSGAAGVIQTLNTPYAPWDNRYRKIDVAISPPRAEAPIVMVTGVRSAGDTMLPIYAIVGAVSSGVIHVRCEPPLFAISTPDHLEIWTLFTPAEVPNFFYLILENYI